MHTDWLSLFNSFIEDTCVVVTVAWGMTRAKGFTAFLGGKTREHRVLIGILFGALATSEIVFPGARAPYVFHTLIVCAAQFVGGIEVALPAIGLVSAAAFGLRGEADGIRTLIALLTVGLLIEVFRRLSRNRQEPILVGLCGGVTQGLAALILNGTVSMSVSSSLANAFGLFMVMLVWNDAKARSESEQHRIEAEHLRTLLVSADLSALKARIRPHFLFNTLAAIAALCDLDPKRAQSSIQTVSQLMRRHIEVDSAKLIPVEKELEYVRAYIEIQQIRFGKRVTCSVELDGNPATYGIPAFSLQTLVENAFQHGVERRSGHSTLRIIVNCRPNRAVFSVRDDGPGMTKEQTAQCISSEDPPAHGLSIADRQLRLMFGDASRIRIYSAKDRGTMVAFKVTNHGQST